MFTEKRIQGFGAERVVKLPGLRIYKAQSALKPLPGDYGLVKMPGAPAHIEAMLLGWRFSHAVICVGHGQLVEAWFDCVRERSIAEYPVQDISWFGVRCAPDGADVRQDQRDRVAEYAIRRLGQPYDYSAWPAVLIRDYWDIDLSGLYAFDPLASCSALVAKAYRAAGLDLVDKLVLNLVTPDDLDPRPGTRRQISPPGLSPQLAQVGVGGLGGLDPQLVDYHFSPDPGGGHAAQFGQGAVVR